MSEQIVKTPTKMLMKNICIVHHSLQYFLDTSHDQVVNGIFSNFETSLLKSWARL